MSRFRHPWSTAARESAPPDRGPSEADPPDDGDPGGFWDHDAIFWIAWILLGLIAIGFMVHLVSGGRP